MNGGWAVVKGEDGALHVLPTGADGKLLPWHKPAVDCGCRPRVLHDKPLDDAVVSHREPDHPGALPQRPDA